MKLAMVGRALFGAFAAGVAAMAPSLAVAQAPYNPVTVNTLADMMNNSAQETFSTTLIMSVATFVVGAGVVMVGLLKLKGAADGQVPLRDGIFRIGGGSLLMAIPFVVSMLNSSIFGGGDTSGSSQDYTATLTAAMQGNQANCSNGGLSQCMLALVSNVYGPAQTVMSVVTFVLGCLCISIGVYRLAQAGKGAEGAAPKMNGTVGYLGGGALLISLGQTMDAVRESIFGGDPGVFAELAYNANSGLSQALQDDANHVFVALFAWMQLIGWLAFARGVYLLIKISQGEGQRTHAHAFTHIVAGALAVNLYGFIEAVQSTLGISLVQVN